MANLAVIVALVPLATTAEAATTTTAPAATTSSSPPTTTTPTTAKPVPPRTEVGKGSWYRHRAGICAHRTLPFGTLVTVINTATGKRTACRVGDRGPFVKGWVIDLHPREFEQLAPTSTGVISVRLIW